ncbi:hypothetical protein Tco_1543218, partial [Tanacetum coccineum]
NIAKLDLKEDKWDNILDEMSKGKDNERNRRLFNNCKRDETKLFTTICEEIKAKMASINVKHSNNVLLAEAVWNTRLLAMVVGQLGDALSVGPSCWHLVLDLSVNRSFTQFLVMPPIRVSISEG